MAKGVRTHSSAKGRGSGPLRGLSKSHGRRHQTRSKKRRLHSKRMKPLSAFFLFMKDKRPLLRCENPTWSVIQMAKKLGSMWHQQPTADKEKYKRQAAKMRQAYRKKKRTRRSRERKKKAKKRSARTGCDKLVEGLETLCC